MASTSSAPVDRLGLLADFHSKIRSEDLETLHEWYDIPTAFKVALPEKNSAAHEHGGDKAPLYIAHLEYGLRLPLPPFMKKVCERLGISPMQLAPNAIAAIMAFLVICFRLKIEPSLQLFSNLVSVTTNKKDAHLFFVNSGRRLVNIPDSNKDWKEKFIWIFNADPILTCPTWPEINKGALKALPLSPSERADLERIRGYAGFRDISNLFDPATLRVASLSYVKPTEEDEEKAKELAAVIADPAIDKEGDVGPADVVTSELPQKRARIGLSNEDMVKCLSNIDEMASLLISPAAAPQAESKKKKAKGARKTSPKAKKIKKAAESAEVASQGVSVPSGQQAQELARPVGEVITIDESSPVREEDRHESAQETLGVDLLAPGQPVIAASTAKATARPGTEPAPEEPSSSGC